MSVPDPLISMRDVNLVRPIVKAPKPDMLAKHGARVGGRIDHSRNRTSVHALRDVSLNLRKGEVLGLLGDNGAGKSTLMKIICGFEKPDSGRTDVRDYL